MLGEKARFSKLCKRLACVKIILGGGGGRENAVPLGNHCNREGSFSRSLKMALFHRDQKHAHSVGSIHFLVFLKMEFAEHGICQLTALDIP